jgi:hypothetical protein
MELTLLTLIQLNAFNFNTKLASFTIYPLPPGPSPALFHCLNHSIPLHLPASQRDII